MCNHIWITHRSTENANADTTTVLVILEVTRVRLRPFLSHGGLSRKTRLEQLGVFVVDRKITVNKETGRGVSVARAGNYTN